MSTCRSLFHRIQAFCDVLLSVALFASIIISVHGLTACSSRPSSVPASFSESSDTARIFPDYRDVVIPPNIAPMNFMVRDSMASEFVVTIADIVCGATSDGKIDIDAAVMVINHINGVKALTDDEYNRANVDAACVR